MNLLIKLTDNCNMNCGYCYDKSNKNRLGGITPTTIRSIVDLVGKESSVDITFHGGEPLLYGLENLEQFIKQLLSTRTLVTFSIQTNGLLIDRDWIRLFREYSIFVSVSCDINTTRQGGITIGRLIELSDEISNIGVISVVTPDNIDNLISVYDNFVSSGISSLSLVPVFDTVNALNPDVHYNRFKELYRHILVTLPTIERGFLQNYSRYFHTKHELCCSTYTCRYNWLTIHPDGSLYPCDRGASSNYYLGNLGNFERFTDVFKSIEYTTYISDTVVLQTNNCTNCDIKDFCRTSCLCNHDVKNATIGSTECDYMRNYYNILNDIFKGVNNA